MNSYFKRGMSLILVSIRLSSIQYLNYVSEYLCRDFHELFDFSLFYEF